MNANTQPLVQPAGHHRSPASIGGGGLVVLHGLFLALATTVLLLSFLMSSDEETRVYLPGFESPLPMTCSTQILMGIPCPGCGLTRAFISISHGAFARAWQLNHASFFVYGFVAAQIPWHGLQLRRIRRGTPPLESNLAYLAPLGLTGLLVVNWVIQLMN